MAGKRPTGQRIKTHRNYDVTEAARGLGVAKGTVRRWLKAGLPCLSDQRPVLILGADLKDFLAKRKKPKQTCRIDECLCLSCKVPRSPAFNEVEYRPLMSGCGNIRALCDVCSTIMHKRVSASDLVALKATLTVTEQQGEPPISNDETPCTNDHLKKEPETHA
jgi:predicted site-specific integrase-resolvase